jgi:hypothetical protein
MTHPRPALRSGRLLVAGMALAMVASLLPLTSASAIIFGLTAATGGGAISADTNGSTGTGVYTSLTGPSIQEGAAGALFMGGTIVLNTPPGFTFNPGQGSAAPVGVGCAGMVVSTLTVTSTQASLTITTASTAACTLQYSGLQVRPTAGNPLAVGNILNTGTTGPAGPANYGTLTEVNGTPVLSFLQGPLGMNTGGVAFPPGQQPIVHSQDQFGHARSGDSITLSLKPGAGTSGAALTCTTNPVTTNAGGNASFTGCAVNLAGTGYQIRADTAGAASADGAVFNIGVGPAAKLAFTSYPAVSTPATLTPSPTVAVEDAGGNVVTTDTRTITLTTNQNPATFVCSGGNFKPAFGGLAAFSCTQSVPANGYTISADDGIGGLAPITGAIFNMTSGVAVKLGFVVQPGSAVAGQPFPVNPAVAIQDVGGTTITSGISAMISLALGANPGSATLTCSGGLTAATVNGVATFTGCSLNTAGTGYTLVATASSSTPPTVLSPATSNAFNVGATAASITVTASQPTITWGEGVVISVHFGTNGGNKTFRLEGARDPNNVANFALIANLTTDAAGDASLLYTPPTNLYYRAVFAGTPDLSAGTSALTRVVVRQIAILRPTNNGFVKMISRGTSITFATTVRPSRPELAPARVTYTVFNLRHGAWVRALTQDVIATALGKAQLVVTFSSTGSWYVRSVANPTPYNANSVQSRIERYDVH